MKVDEGKISEVEYFNGDELAASVWRGKYAMEGEVNPDDMHRRLAKEFSRIEEDYQNLDNAHAYVTKKLNLSDYGKTRKDLNEDSIYDLFKDFKYIVPQGSIMFGLGRTDKYISLSNCFVIPSAEDSYGGIFKTDQEQVQLMKRRGGVGHDISNLRPEGTEVSNSAGTSTGVVSFMERFSNSTREVAQNGRRGALMLSIDINHPDVERFATIKSDLTKVTGANISIKVNKAFMEAVKNDDDYLLRFPCDYNFSYEYPSTFEYGILTDVKVSDERVIKVKRIKAKELWDTITTQAKNNAEPGLMFWDNVMENDPAAVYDEYKPVSSNPCGEQYLQPYDSCRLMCMNLFSIVKYPFTKGAEIDYELLYSIAYEQQRLMDDLVDLEIEYVDRIIEKIKNEYDPNINAVELSLWKNIKEAAINGRRTGSGITALADMLAALNVKYDSQEALNIVEKVMHTKMKAELDCTIDLGILRGSFNGWDKTKEYGDASSSGLDIYGKNEFYYSLITDFNEQFDRMYTYGRRNISWSTIAPTGSVSILTGTSSGCEPLFMPYYMRRKKVNPSDKEVRVDFVDQNGDSWQEFPVMHPKFKDWINTNFDKLGMSGFEDLNNLDKDFLQESFKKSPWYNSTANDIDWYKRLEMQAVLQKYTTNAISSTLNLPETVTLEEVQEIYSKGYDLGLKGVTIYVEGSRSGVLVDSSKKKTTEFEYHDAPKRPKCLPVEIHTTVSKGTKWNVIVGLFNGKPYEVFAVPYFTNETELELCKVKKGRYDLLKNGETYSEDITSQMTDEQDVVTRLTSSALRHGADITFLVEQLNKSNGDITSFGKAISRCLKKYINVEKVTVKSECPECKSELTYEEGCKKCPSCGYSAC